MKEALCEQFAGLVLLQQMIGRKKSWHVGLLDDDDSLLEPYFNSLLRAGVLDIGSDDHYQVTAKGYQAFELMLHQRHSYMVHFDVYAWVDLDRGVFGDAELDAADDPRWTDLRVAVARHKGIDAHRLVFLAMLTDAQFTTGKDWRHEMALGSSFFDELDELVDGQVGVDELGYEDEQGRVSGADVLEDVILQGAALNAERMQQTRAAEQREHVAWTMDEQGERGEQDRVELGWDGEGHPAAGAVTEAAPETSPAGGNGEGALFTPYHPQRALRAYAGSATYAEPLWHKPYW